MVVASLRDDQIGKAFGGFDKLEVHRFDGAFVTFHHFVYRTSAFYNVAIDYANQPVVGISVDSAASHAAFAGKHNLPFPLLADADGKVAASYDALTDLVVVKFAKRHTFLIDPQGRIRQRYTDLDTKTYTKTLIADLERLVTAP